MQQSFNKSFSVWLCSSVVSSKEEKRKKKKGLETVLFTSIWGWGRPALFATCHVFFCCSLFSLVFFFSFSLGGGQSFQGAMMIWPRVVCVSTVCHLAHLVECFYRASRSWRLAAREPSWFLCLLWSGDAMRGLGVWKNRGFASSPWFFLQGVSPASLQDFILGSSLSASFL
jgi:hypothetical protein